jgi:hypothetical protein
MNPHPQLMYQDQNIQKIPHFRGRIGVARPV